MHLCVTFRSFKNGVSFPFVYSPLFVRVLKRRSIHTYLYIINALVFVRLRRSAKQSVAERRMLSEFCIVQGWTRPLCRQNSLVVKNRVRLVEAVRSFGRSVSRSAFQLCRLWAVTNTYKQTYIETETSISIYIYICMHICIVSKYVLMTLGFAAPKMPKLNSYKVCSSTSNNTKRQACVFLHHSPNRPLYLLFYICFCCYAAIEQLAANASATFDAL